MLYSQHKQWHNDRKWAKESEKAVAAAEAMANATHPKKAKMQKPANADDAAAADNDAEDQVVSVAYEEEEEEEVANEAINFPHVDIRRSGFEVRDYLYDLGETVDEMADALSFLKECLVDNNVAGYEAPVAGFLDACDWICIYCAVHLEVVHLSFIANSRGAVQFNFENHFDVAERIVARFVGSSLRDEYYTLMAMYDGNQHE